jgi:hypothetical protein
VRTFYVRRKDLSHVPFQFYVTSAGVERPLEKGVMSTFAISPPKRDFDVVHVQILADFARELEQRWDIHEADLVRIAAKVVEVWLKDEPIPADHFYGPDMLKVDKDWYPQEPDHSPSLSLSPYSFDVETDEPWPSILDWDFGARQADASNNNPAAGPPILARCVKTIVFGYTLDVFPGPLIIGYNQLKHKIEEAALGVSVKMLPLSDLPAEVDYLFVPLELAEAARQAAPHSRVEALDSFLNHPSYNTVVEELSVVPADQSAA